MAVYQKRRGVGPGILRQEPYFPDKVREIVALRRRGATLKEIASQMGMTESGVHQLIKRWSDWANET